MKTKWLKGIVQKGDGSGRKIGFPTANLDPSIVPSDLKEGVYACLVSVGPDKIFKGALFYGPRMVKGETHKQLEIYILNFSKNIYGEEIEFKIGKYIREVRPCLPAGRDFGYMGELKRQMEKDVSEIQLTRLPDGQATDI